MQPLRVPPQKKSNLIPLKNEINEMISFLISPKTLSVSMEILVRDFQCLDVDMIDSAWKVLVLARKGNVDLNG